MRNTITTGTFTLPLCLTLGSMVWLLPEVGNPLLWGGWFVAIATTLLWAELTNRETLLRERSQMIGAVYFAGLLLLPNLHSGSIYSWLPLVLLCSFYCLFKTFQVHRPEGYVYYAFLLLSIAIAICAPLLWLIPVYWGCMGLYFQKFNLKTWTASLFGLCTPWILWLLWQGVQGVLPVDNDVLLSLVRQKLSAQFSASCRLDISYWQHLLATPITDITPSEWQVITATGWLFALSVVSTIHFHLSALQDKLQVRTFFQTMLWIELTLWFCFAFIIEEKELVVNLPLLISAPFLAHFFTLGRGWFANITFFAGITTYVLLLIFNNHSTWILSLIYS